MTTHDFRTTYWGHNLGSVKLEKKRRLFRPAQIRVTGVCWTYKPVRAGDTFVWLGDPEVGEVTAEITKVEPAPTVRDMSFWEGVITSHEAAEFAQ